MSKIVNVLEKVVGENVKFMLYMYTLMRTFAELIIHN